MEPAGKSANCGPMADRTLYKTAAMSNSMPQIVDSKVRKDMNKTKGDDVRMVAILDSYS